MAHSSPGWSDLSVPEPVSPDSRSAKRHTNEKHERRVSAQQLPSPSHFSFSDITTAADLYLLREIASLPMTELSPREVKASQGTEGKVIRMLGLDGTQSSPIIARNTTPDVPSLSTPTTLARAPSTPSSLRRRLFSPNPINQLTRRLSLSPLSARNRRAELRSSNSTSKLGEFSQKMSTPTTPETVRKRRGFRPLSIVTSALFPFDFDPVQTMENAQSSQLDPPTSAKTPPIASTDLERSEPQVLPSVTSDTDSDSTPSPSKAASVTSGHGQDDSSGARCDDLSITSTVAIKRIPAPSIQAQIKRTPAPSIQAQIEKIKVAEYLRRQEAATVQTPEDRNADTEANTKDVQIVDEYPQFYNLPPPDPNNHPAFRLDPFNCTDDAKPLMTNWTKYQIKQWTADKYLRDRNMLPEQNPESKSPLKKILPFDKKSPEKEETSIFEALAEGSPAPASAKRKTPQTPSRDTFGSITPSELRVGSSTFTPITDEFDKKSKGGRSLSSLFKRSGTDNSKSSNSSTLTISSPIDQSIINPAATSELRRHDLERYLRIICNSPHIQFHWGSMYPRHPNTSNEWKSRNLKCTTCLSSCCAVCGRACCAYKAATLGLENHKNNPHGREEAYQRIVDISAVFPYGKEAPTFLECTSCKKMVCPDCCGMCPIDGCGDLECRKCKRPNPWRECDWHFQSVRCASISTLRSDVQGPPDSGVL